MATTIDATLLLRSMTEQQMNQDRPILLENEIVHIKNKGFKMGDGVSTANILKYVAGGEDLQEDGIYFIRNIGTAQENFNNFKNTYNAAVEYHGQGKELTFILYPGRFEGDGFILSRINVNIMALVPGTVSISSFQFGENVISASRSYFFFYGLNFDISTSQFSEGVCTATFKKCLFGVKNRNDSCVSQPGKLNRGIFTECRFGSYISGNETVNALPSFVEVSKSSFFGEPFGKFEFAKGIYIDCVSKGQAFNAHDSKFIRCFSESGESEFNGNGSVFIDCIHDGDGNVLYFGGNNIRCINCHVNRLEKENEGECFSGNSSKFYMCSADDTVDGFIVKNNVV